MTDANVRTSEEAETQAEQQAAEQPAGPASESGLAIVREAAELKDKLLRALAEMENLRRRTEREVADARHYGIAAFARDILGVADNMRRALEAGGPKLREAMDAAHVTALVDGVELTERELLKVLEKHGIRKVEPQGEKFDPNLHQAMYEVADPSLPAGSVAQVIQAGYMIGDRILRPALVAIAKGGGKAAEPAANDNSGTTQRGP
jgi:molecular chaperone GrpE